MVAEWKSYQERVAQFFQLLGLEAHTDVKVQGTRTSHDVDVLVKSTHAGFDVTWLVECKHWERAISKLHVIALRQIVIDVGADRGILLSESGFQRGAQEAATLTNVQLASLDDLNQTTSASVHAMRLQDLSDRLFRCHAKNTGKSRRKAGSCTV